MDTSKQASQYIKGYIQNIWKRDENGEVVKPFNKIGEQFKVIQTINLSEPRPGDVVNMEELQTLIANSTIDISQIVNPNSKN